MVSQLSAFGGWLFATLFFINTITEWVDMPTERIMLLMFMFLFSSLMHKEES